MALGDLQSAHASTSRPFPSEPLKCDPGPKFSIDRLAETVNNMAGNVRLSENQIKRLISHREPFLLLGQAVTNDIGERVRVVARQKLPHALSNRMYLVEGLGQATALLIRQMDEYKNSGIPVIAAMRNIRWNDCEPIEGTLLYSAVLNRALNSRFVIADAAAHVDDVEICSGQLVASFQTVTKGKAC